MCSFHFPKPSIAILDHHLGNGGVHRALIQGKHLNQLVQMEGIVDGGIREQVGSWVTQRPTLTSETCRKRRSMMESYKGNHEGYLDLSDGTQVLPDLMVDHHFFS
jgi:hypothetical protein